MSFIQLFSKPSTSQRHPSLYFWLQNITVTSWSYLSILLMESFKSIKNGKKANEKVLFVITKIET